MKKKLGTVRSLSLKSRKPLRPTRSVQSNEATPKGIESRSIGRRFSDEQWQLDKATLRRAAEDLAHRRATQQLERRARADQFDRIAATLTDCSDEQRASTIRQLYLLDPERTASFLNIVLHSGTHDERQQIGRALEQSGLVAESIAALTGSSHGHSYRAFSVLFLVAKAGTVAPLMRVIEDHPNIELRLALIRLLSTSGAPDLAIQFQRLLAKNSLPVELCVAMKDSQNQLGTSFQVTPSAA